MNAELPLKQSLAGRAGVIILILLIMAAVAQTMARFIPELLRDDLYSGDAQQHIWWLYRFIDPSLFPNDPIAAYYSLPSFSPLGYQFLMRMLSHVLDPQHAAESLAIVLALIAISLMVALGHHIGKKTGSCAALAAYILWHSEGLLDGGYPRSFGLVLLLLGVLAICQRRLALLGLVFAVAPLVYAPLVLNLAPVAAIVLGIGLITERRLPRGYVPLLIFGMIGVALIALTYLRPLPADVGPWFTLAEGKRLPEMRPGGRTAFFRAWDTMYFKSPVSGIGLTPRQTIAAAVALLLAVAWRPRAMPLSAWALLFGALLMFVAAHRFLFKLYLPSRYTSYAFPVFTMMAMAAYAREIKRFILAREDRFKPWLRCGAIAIAIAFCAVSFVGSARAAIVSFHEPGYGGTTAGFESVLVYLRTLPVDTLIAAHPNDANAIPLRTRRSVLANTETSVAFNKNYYLRMRGRINAIFAMLYAQDWQTIDAEADQQGVRIFVLDRTRLTSPEDRPYFRPFAATNAARIAAGKSAGFAMQAPPPDRVLFTNGEWVVLHVGRHGR